MIEDIGDPGHEGGLHVDTTQNSFFVNGAFAPTSRVNVLGEYERGSYDNPFTLVTPTSMDRVKARIRLRPTGDVSVVGTFLTRRLNNDLAGSIHPTERRPGEPAALRTTDITVRATYDRTPVSVFGAYSRRDLSNEVVNQIVTEPGFLGGLQFEIAALYESNLDMGSGGARVALSELVAVGTEILAYRNRGTFGLDWEQYRFFVGATLTGWISCQAELPVQFTQRNGLRFRRLQRTHGDGVCRLPVLRSLVRVARMFHRLDSVMRRNTLSSRLTLAAVVVLGALGPRWHVSGRP